MGIALDITFLCVELTLIVFVLLAIVRTGFSRLNSSVGIGRDGFPPGKAVPSWSLPDLKGHLRVTPAHDHWQLLIFGDHSLATFPDLISGMHHLGEAIQELEVIVLSRDSRELCEATIRGLDLRVPIVPVDQAFYDHFRVRTMPFAFFLDPRGIVHWVGLVNTENWLFHTWQMIQATEQSDSSERRIR